MNTTFQKCNDRKQDLEDNQLQVLVNEYNRCGWICSYVLEDQWWADNLTWEAALERAWKSRLRDGKMHSHQCRVAHKLPQGLKISLDTNVQPDIFKNFHDLYSWVKSITSCVKGLGATTTYDVARRLGVWIGMQPEVVYLHAGTATGARKLDIKGETAPLSAFPIEIHKLGASHAENFLCIYKERI